MRACFAGEGDRGVFERPSPRPRDLLERLKAPIPAVVSYYMLASWTCLLTRGTLKTLYSGHLTGSISEMREELALASLATPNTKEMSESSNSSFRRLLTRCCPSMKS